MLPRSAAFSYFSTQSISQKVQGPPLKEEVHSKAFILKSKRSFSAQLTGRITRWLLSRRFQIAAQATMGVLFISLFVFVRQLRFPNSCLAVILMLLGMIQHSAHPHIGCLIMTACAQLFAALLVTVYAGAIASLAYATGEHHYPGSLIAFAVIGYVPLACLHASAGRPAPGVQSCVIYGQLIILSNPRHTMISLLWSTEVIQLMAAMSLAAASMILAGTLVLPTLAGAKLQNNISQSLHAVGHLISGYASIIASTNEGLEARQMAEERASGSKGDSNRNIPSLSSLEAVLRHLNQEMRVPELWDSEVDFFRCLNERTDPKAIGDKPNETPIPLAADLESIRSLLMDCKTLIPETKFEPMWLQNGPLVPDDWTAVLNDLQSLLTRVGALGNLVEGGMSSNYELILEACGLNPLPAIGLVLAKMAAMCNSLSSAICRAPGVWEEELAGHPDSLLSLQQGMRGVVTSIASKAGNRQNTYQLNDSTPQALQVRLILYLVMLVHGMVPAIIALENTVPWALGIPKRIKIQDQRRDAGAGSLGIYVQKEKADSQPRKRAVSWAQHLVFIRSAFEMIFGLSNFQRLRGTAWRDFTQAMQSWEHFKRCLTYRRVQYFAKFWLTTMAVLVASVLLEEHHPHTKEWKLQYAYITAIVVSIPKVEAVAWKAIQRIVGTIVGGVLGYLIMLRPSIHSRGVVTGTLVCVCVFAIANALDTRLKYTCYLTALTLSVLTLCQFGSCCSHGQDFRLWKERTINIVAAAVFSMVMSWLILPWFSSDSQLMLIAHAYLNSAKMMALTHEAFCQSCENAAKGREPLREERLADFLEAKIVQPVELAVLSLSTEVVIWKTGLLSTPHIVKRLVVDMKDMIHRLTALRISALQAATEFGPATAAIYHHYVLPSAEQKRSLFNNAMELAQACQPLLEKGPNPTGRSKVEESLVTIGIHRNALRSHIEELRHASHPSTDNNLTPEDILRLGSYLVAKCHVMDKLMMIARVIIDDSFGARESRLSSLAALDGPERDDFDDNADDDGENGGTEN